MEAVSSFETSTDFYQTTCSRIIDDSILLCVGLIKYSPHHQMGTKIKKVFYASYMLMHVEQLRVRNAIMKAFKPASFIPSLDLTCSVKRSVSFRCGIVVTLFGFTIEMNRRVLTPCMSVSYVDSWPRKTNILF
jgi:hypothetical protein